MNIGAIILVVSMLVFMALGTPIFLSIILSGVATIAMTGGNFGAIISRLYNANDNFPLMAIPFFFLAGELMLQGGIAKRIVGFCQSLLGRLRGSLSIITFVACAFFGAISGSSYATTASIGKLMYPQMRDEGYEPDFAAVLQAVGGTLGVLIPPSLLCVLYGVATGSSVGDMLLMIAPVGLLTTLVYIFTALFLIRGDKNKYYHPTEEVLAKQKTKLGAKAIGKEFLGAFWALVTPVIILGGIYAGVFTPTECAIIATVYAWLVGTFVYKELNLKATVKAIISSAIGSATTIIIVDAANVFSWLLTIKNVAASVANAVSNANLTAITFLLVVNIVYLIAGMFVEGSVTITIITPLLFPIAVGLGINPIHFGCITILNCIIGTLTPPFGGALFITTSVTGIPVTNLVKRVWPFLITAIMTIFIVTYVPFAWLY